MRCQETRHVFVLASNTTLPVLLDTCRVISLSFAAVSRPSVRLKADLMLVPRDYKITRTFIKRELWGVREQGGANTSSATSMNTVQGLLLVSLPLHSVSLSSRALKPKCPRICTLPQITRYIHTRNSWYYPGKAAVQ